MIQIAIDSAIPSTISFSIADMLCFQIRHTIPLFNYGCTEKRENEPDRGQKRVGNLEETFSMNVGRVLPVIALNCLSLAAMGQSGSQNSTPSSIKSAEVAVAVARMARVGSAVGPRFSPDGK